MMALIAVPAAIALSTIDGIRPPVPPTPQSSALGYTWSLLFFIIPSVIMAVWFHGHENGRANRRSFWISLAVLFGLGAGLDIFFASTFFTFVNEGATLGVQVPVVGGAVPVEEFGFYSFGFAAILLTYIWIHESWIPGLPDDVKLPSQRVPLRDLVSFHGSSFAIGVALVVVGLVWEEWGPGADSAGYPGYLLFLIVVGVLPNIIFFRAVGPYIDWPALSFTMVLLLPVSLLWEGVLASPYQWWGYQADMMVGVDVAALSGLPIEAVLLWFVAAWAGVTLYEVCRLVFGVRSQGGSTHDGAASVGGSLGSVE
jgi:hypothetical protein